MLLRVNSSLSGGMTVPQANTETARVATQTVSPLNARFYRLENNVGAELKKNIEFIFLTHEGAQKIHPRDKKTQGWMRTLEFEWPSEASAQRGGFEQTRDYLQRSLNASK